MKKIFVPDQSDVFFERTTQLCIGAHQDDIEILTSSGIIQCLDSSDQWFSGIVCTNGAGSSRTGTFAKFSDQEMMEVRHQEQIEAAKLGKYSFIAQLGFTSAQVKSFDRQFIESLSEYILKAKPQIIYTHNPFDKHPTHIAVFKATMKALELIKDSYTPSRVLGCEVWRNLDWVFDSKKVILDSSRHEDFILSLLAVYESQIQGGKRYDLATIGRMRANATYFESHQTDNYELISFAIDLTQLAKGEISQEKFVIQYTDEFVDQLRKDLI